MKRKATDILRLMVSITCMTSFGTGVLIVGKNIVSEEVRWLFEVLSASLFLLIFFWLLAQEESLKQGNGRVEEGGLGKDFR
jgi:multisubunit Na+/H+ antiporter MnhG subunit